ncbi:MAG: precorrin-4 C(11)-methyltransferase [Victivallales bacterium]|jgi:precorrin-4 C11-methyltransferase|nr:precorrin-4 C(11)-methyltransferase [Victivallales bacterium]
MSGKITFVGAGPGAIDLITLRGVSALEEAEIVVYAGSLVNEKLLERAQTTQLVNSAKLTLSEVITCMAEGFRAGKRVVRLHTGDPAIYGAVAEQYRELDRLGIPYEVVPGVSSAFAAAAALKVELTMPEVSQSVIFSRVGGRTTIPESEELEHLAACGTTLCLYLSVGEMISLVQKLRATGMNTDTPVAVVYRASWENEKIVRGTLKDIAEKVEKANIHRQAMIIIGRVLDRAGENSKLYCDTFPTAFREADKPLEFSGKVAIFALTRIGTLKAAEIAPGLQDAQIVLPQKYANLVPAQRLICYPDGGFAKAFKECWGQYDGLIMVCAAGIAIRHMAKLIDKKSVDPAIVVCDTEGNYALSLLSGHLGGANRLAKIVAKITNGKPVITTATDSQNIMALDELAARFHYRIDSMEKLKKISSAILDGKSFELSMSQELFERYYADNPQFKLIADTPDITVKAVDSELILHLYRRNYTLGIGCRRGVSAEAIDSAINEVLSQNLIAPDLIIALGTAELKRDEPGLLEFAQQRSLSLHFFSAEELNCIEVPNPSKVATLRLGIHSVAEAAALLSAGPGAKLIVPKTAKGAVTVAVAEVANG